jgi:hypothetical protein
MRAYLRHTALATAAAASVFVAAPQQAKAQTYPIDCAILLCLSGGWPASVPCARARAEFIRRITPWPVEPPLQIWRCPMGASFEADPDRLSATRIWDALLDDVEMPLQSFPGAPLTDEDPALAPQPAVFRHESGGAAMPLPEGFSLQLAQDHINEDGSADIDIGGAEFNFVRSIRVYMIRGSQWVSGRDDDDCNRSSSVRLGSYGVQGDYRWSRSSLASVPPAFRIPSRWGDHCPGISMRSVFVDWRDYDGNYGWERVDY